MMPKGCKACTFRPHPRRIMTAARTSWRPLPENGIPPTSQKDNEFVRRKMEEKERLEYHSEQKLCSATELRRVIFFTRSQNNLFILLLHRENRIWRGPINFPCKPSIFIESLTIYWFLKVVMVENIKMICQCQYEISESPEANVQFAYARSFISILAKKPSHLILLKRAQNNCLCTHGAQKHRTGRVGLHAKRAAFSFSRKRPLPVPQIAAGAFHGNGQVRVLHCLQTLLSAQRADIITPSTHRIHIIRYTCSAFVATSVKQPSDIHLSQKSAWFHKFTLRGEDMSSCSGGPFVVSLRPLPTHPHLNCGVIVNSQIHRNCFCD